MRVRVISDIHLEIDEAFYAFNDNKADILIISGDFYVADYLTRSEASPYTKTNNLVHYFLERAARDYEHVFYVPGNHESYYGSIHKTDTVLKEFCSKWTNVHYMNNDSLVIGDTTFIGGTLWTDFYKGNPAAMNTVQHGMNDFRIIKQGYSKFRPIDAMAEFVNTKEYFASALKNTKKAVIMSHHAPCFKSVADQYMDDYYLNAGYYSNLEEFILDHPQIVLWTHGHIHNSSDYRIGTTRIVCNPKGYNHENNVFNPNMVIEI